MNLFSALAAAITVALVFRLTQLVIEKMVPATVKSPQRVTPGLSAAIAFGLSPIWWSQATIAEVYTLHNLLAITLLLLTLHLSAALPTCFRQRSTSLLFFIVGLGLTHHRTIVLLVPGLIVLLWEAHWLWRPSRSWLRWAVALVLPLLLYLYMPLRATSGVRDLNGSYINTWAGFWNHVLALDYTGFFTENSLTRTLTDQDWAALWIDQYGAVGLALGLLSVGWSVVRGANRRLGLGLLVILLTNLGFALLYRVGDPEVFMLPAWLTFAPFIGIGVATVRQVNWLPRPVARATTALLLFAIVVAPLGRDMPINRSHDWDVHDYAVALAKVDFPPESRVMGLEGQITALRYMQQAEGLGLQATGIVANDPAERVMAIDSAMQAGFPTYITQEVAGIAERYSFSGEGPLVRVWPAGAAQVKSPDHPMQAPFADGTLTLLGYDLIWLDEAGGPAIQLVLYWQPTQPLSAIYKLSLRLQDEAGVAVQYSSGENITADRFPLHQVALTNNWRINEIIRDIHRLRIPTSATSEATQLLVILYDAGAVAEVGRVVFPLR